MESIAPLRLQVGLLKTILLLASGALLHRIFLFETPAPPAVNWTNLNFPGYTFQILEQRGELADRVYARGRSARFEISGSGVDGIRLEVGLVHSRESETFEVPKMTEGQAGVMLKDATIKASQLLPNSQLLVGSLDGKTAVQACLISGSAAAVEVDRLVQLREAQRVRSTWETVRHILGLRDNIRWECALVTMTSSNADDSLEELESVFRDLLESVGQLYASSVR